MKLYKYFLINRPNELYAYTFDKKMSKKFEKNRIMDQFHREKTEINSLYEVELYSRVNELQELIEFTLYDKHDNAEYIVCPLHESLYSDSLISQWCNNIPEIIDNVINDYSEYLKTSTVNQLLILASQLKNMNSSESIIFFNTLKLFEELF